MPLVFWRTYADPLCLQEAANYYGIFMDPTMEKENGMVLVVWLKELYVLSNYSILTKV